MKRFLSCAAALAAIAALAACQPPMPNSAPDRGAGVGFDRVDAARAARDAQLRGEAPVTPILPGPNPVSESVLVAQPADPNALPDIGGGPVQASPTNPAPQAVTNSAGISQEQDFDAVSGQRDIDDDAARLAAARAQYVVIEPSALPTRPGSNVPNIVEYALRTNNPVGAQIYRRTGFNAQNRFLRNCAGFASPDIAQEEFLMRGGPQRDRRGLDPDGDGFACAWDPTPFRRAVQSAPVETE